MRGRNNIPSHCHYRINTELGKGVFGIHRIPYECPACVYKIDKYWLPTIYKSSQRRYEHVEDCYYKIEHYNDWIIMEFLDNNTPQVDFDNIHAFIISGISTNK